LPGSGHFSVEEVVWVSPSEETEEGVMTWAGEEGMRPLGELSPTD